MPTPARRHLALLLLGAGLLAPAARAQTDAELRTRLIGPWREERTVGCVKHQQQVRLQEDGRFEANGLLDDCGKVTLFVWRGTWAVRDFRFVYVTSESSAPALFPAGSRIEDEIIAVTADEWIMLEQASGQRSAARRVK